MPDLAQLGLAVDSSQVKAATGDLKDFSKAGQQAQQSADGVTDALSKAKGPSAEFAKNFAAADAQQGNYSKSANKVVDSLANQYVRLNATGKEWAQLSAIQKAGVDISSDAAGHIAGMAGSLYDLEQAQKRSTAATDNSNNSLERFANTMTRRVIFAFLVAGVREFTRYLVDLNAQIALTADTANRVNISGQTFQGLQAAASNKAIGNSDFNAGMLAFNQQIDLAKHGLGDLATLLRSNGQSVSDTATTFGRIADLVMRAKGDYALQVSILRQAGLPATQQWVSLLEQGSGEINKIAETSSKLSDQQLKEAKELNDQWNEMWTNFETWGKRAVVNTVNAMKELARAGSLPGNAGELDQLALSTGNVPAVSSSVIGLLRRGGHQSNQTEANSFYDAVGIGKSASRATPFNPEITKQQIALEQQRIGLLGPLATVEDQVRAKQLEINAASLNNVGISKSQAAALLDITRAQAEMTRVQQQAQIGVFNLSDAQKAANDNLRALVDQKLLDPNNPEQWAAATNAAAKSIENLANQARVAGAPLEQLQRLANDASSSRAQLDQFSTTTLNSMSDNLVNIANGSQSAGQAFKNFGLAVVTALEKMIIQMTIIGPIAKSLQGLFGGGLGFLGLGFSDGGFVNPGSSSNPLPGLSASDYGVGFASGGYTGAGGKYDPAGIVHRGEYVFDAVNTNRLGVGFLDSLRGYADGGLVAAPNVVPMSRGGQDNQSVVITYAPTIDARGADPAAVARLASAQADDRKNFERKVQSIMVKTFGTNPAIKRVVA